MWVDDPNAPKKGIDGLVEHLQETVQSFAQAGSAEYDMATLSRITDRWQRLADLSEDALTNSRPMVQVVGPGLDEASNVVAERANCSGQAYLKMLGEMRLYCQQQANACSDAMLKIENTEYENVDQLRAIGASGGLT